MIICAEVIGTEDNRLIVLDKASQQEVAVNTRCLNFNKGDKVKITYNGIMTRSIPPQICAESIVRLPDNSADAYLLRYNEILNTMTEEMCSAELTDSISRNFIVQMIPHHRAAVEMSENILKYTNNAELISIAQNIVSEQTKSIENMQAALETCSSLANCPCDVNSYQSKFRCITKTMFYKMRNACSDCCVNCDFIREMIPHHEGAVSMSLNALSFEICPVLKPVLNAIIVSQENGIRQMKCLAKNLNYK